jgi:elongation factor G
MGELHLEITKDRLRKDYEVEAYMGPLQVAYKETITSEMTDTLEFSRVLGMRL